MRIELYRHEQRMRELQALTPHLQRLQAWVPALQAQGVALSADAINLDDSRKGRPAVYITAPLQDPANHALYRALVTLGFEAREQLDHGTHARLLMCRAAVRISLAAALPLPEVQALAGVETAAA